MPPRLPAQPTSTGTPFRLAGYSASSWHNGPMLVVLRFLAGVDDETDLRELLAVMQCQVGFESGTLGRSPDEPDSYCMTMTFADVGSFRRSLSRFEVKMAFGPVQSKMLDEPSAYEVLYEVTGGNSQSFISSLADDADSAGPRRR